MRNDCKKRKKFGIREKRKAKQVAGLNLKFEAALRAVNDEATRNKDLASKYYSLWKRCAKQKKEIVQLLDKTCKRVGKPKNPFFILLLNLLTGAVPTSFWWWGGGVRNTTFPRKFLNSAHICCIFNKFCNSSMPGPPPRTLGPLFGGGVTPPHTHTHTHPGGTALLLTSGYSVGVA